MKTSKKSVYKKIVQAIIILLTAATVGLMPGIGSNPAMANGKFSLLAATMTPLDSKMESKVEDGFLRTTRASTEPPYTAAYIGQLDLPHGARITSVRCQGVDTDPMSEFTIQLNRYNLYSTPAGSPVTSLAGSGNQPNKVEVSAVVNPALAVIDNDQYSYGLLLQLPTAYSAPNQDLRVLRCVVDTTYTLQLPLLQRNDSQ